MLFEPLDAILGTRVKVRLLRVLVRGWSASGRALAADAGVAHMPALRALEDLVALGVVIRTTLGRQHQFSLNLQHSLVKTAIIPAFNAESEGVQQIFTLIGAAVRPIRKQIEAVYLFGSSARGDDRPGSDLDIALITKDEEDIDRLKERFDEALSALRSEYGQRTSLLVMTKSGFRELARKQHPLSRGIISDHRVILGPDPERLLL